MSRQKSEGHFSHPANRVRVLRESRKFSQRELARLSRLSPNTLSLIERGKISPTAATMHKIAAALDVPVTAFFEPEEAVSLDIHHTKAGERQVIESEGITGEPLGVGGSLDTPVSPLLITVDAGRDSGEMMAHLGQEFVYCLTGKITYIIDTQTFTLETGDSLLFPAEKPHRWRNPGTEPAQMLIVLCNTHKHSEVSSGDPNG